MSKNPHNHSLDLDIMSAIRDPPTFSSSYNYTQIHTILKPFIYQFIQHKINSTLYSDCLFCGGAGDGPGLGEELYIVENFSYLEQINM